MCKIKNIFKILFFFVVVFLLNGCDGLLFNPKGNIAKEEYSLIMFSFILMLFVVVPVIFMTIYFSRKYRASNANQIYKPNWSDSLIIELFVWTVPMCIIFLLACLTWNYSHKLEPSRALLSDKNPIEINVVSLDWRWLFIYPKYHVATINKIVFPINRPIIFHITSNSVMNSFFIPALGSQIYAMPGMVTTLNLVANDSGKYKGISSNYSGKGFSNMKFIAQAVTNDQCFIKWIKTVNLSPKILNNMNDFFTLAKPSEHYSTEYFSQVNTNLFHDIVKQFNSKYIISD